MRDISTNRDINVRVGQRLRMKREYFGYSREKYAEMLGISSRFLADIELGVKGMSYSTLMRACDTLGTSPNDLICGSQAEEEPQDRTVINELLDNLDPEYLHLALELLYTFVRTIAIAKNKNPQHEWENLNKLP